MKKLVLVSFFFSLSFSMMAQTTILINNVQIFDGVNERLVNGNVLIQGDTIARISASPIPADRSANTRIIDGKGKFLMPGLIDAHWHTMMCAVPEMVLLTADVGYLNLVAAHEAENTLLRGFTSVRDLAGPSFGLKRAIDQGLTAGPRIYPSGAMITQSGGHGDFRLPYEVPSASNAPPEPWGCYWWRRYC